MLRAVDAPHRIRPIVASDWKGWLPLWDGYVNFYREELEPEVTRSTFDRLCAGADEMFGFVAESSDGTLIGLVHALLHTSTWSTGTYCYLEDLFVSRSGRGGSVARDLIEQVCAEAASRGSDKVYWHTQQFNGPGRSLYDQVAKLSSFVVYERSLEPG